MAKIVPSDLAPSDSVHYSFAGVEFDLGGSGKGSTKSYTSTDRVVLDNAAVHPWLTVQYDQAEQISGSFSTAQVRPEDDPLSAIGPNANVAFDPEEIAKVEEAKAAGVTSDVAIEAGLDQSEQVEEGGVAETVASAETSNDGETN